jgi:peptidoglycan/xylan/chitin deacetylase (PgdA/CDA1 family)
VALTFDDGYQDFYSAAVPIMRPLGITATNYVPTMLVGRSNYMTWSEIQQLDSEGYEMAAHSQFHVDVSRVAPARAKVEVVGSKADLEQHLGHPVVDWAYPYGAYSDATLQLVSQAGYLSAVTTRAGGWHNADQMPLLTRVRVGGGESLAAFAGSLNP